MYTTFAPIAGWLVLLGTLAYAWLKGAAPERFGAVLLVCATLLALFIDKGLPAEARVTSTLIGEGLLALGFLILAIRYASLWLGGAMILQGLQFGLHAFYIVMERSSDWPFWAVSNLVTFGIIACILVGVTVSWRRKRALARA